MTDLPLSIEHRAELEMLSAISPQQLLARGYRTVTAAELPDAFADYQRRDGLLIPLRTVRGEIESWQLKPNNPRIGKNGRPIKYETAANAPQVIDVPTSALPHLANPKIPLVITEGAKKVDAAVSAKLFCIIGLQGVYGWRGTGEAGGKTALPDWENIALNNRQVLIAFDSDVMTKAAVRAALDRLAGFLRSRGARVAYLLLPSLENGAKCGLDDWFALSRDMESLLTHIVANLPPLAQSGEATSGEIVPVAFSMAEIESRPIDWLWPNWLPKGMLTLLGGYAGDGKSTITMSLAATLSNGGTLPDGTQAPQINTLLMVAEDDLSHVVKPRLEVHGANTDRIHVLQSLRSANGEIRSINLRRDIPYLQHVVQERDIDLVIIDPLSSYLATSDRNNEGDVRDTLQPLVNLMEKTGTAVIGIMHIGKNDGQNRAFQKLMGSTAFTALARCVWMVNTLPTDFQVEDEPVRKMLGVSKSNYAVSPTPLVFSRPLDGAIAFHGASPIGIEEAFTWRPKEVTSPTETAKAEDWLLRYMDGKRVLASEVESAAKAEGFGFPTVRKAKKRMKIASVKEMNQWYWLPAVDDSVEVA